ncbi:ribonuclease HII [Anaplasmataceae bacterium AB001_6]|nr:ribonuclease HII [Anaplasmataceae bacterium AB001_6]
MKIIGIDEVGRGSLIAGVYSVAVLLDNDNLSMISKLDDFFYNGLKDSKKLDENKRKAFFHLFENKLQFAVGFASAQEIDELNILQATLLSMKRAYISLNQYKVDCIIIDGNKIPQIDFSCEIKCINKADEKELSVACASIFAKHIRDTYIKKLHRLFPFYNWNKNKGYATKSHIDAIKNYGFTCFHRMSFEPIKTIVRDINKEDLKCFI